MIDLIGQTIGDYQLEALLGAGSTGQLFRARHLRLERPAALRVLDLRLTAVPDFQGRFFEVLRRAATLRNPRIVEIYDFGTHHSLYYIAMGWHAGGSLRAELDRRRRERREQAGWPLAVSLRLAEQIADGLAYAHGQGVVHGALTPRNLLLRRDDTGPTEAYALKISDFGLARLLPDEALREPAYLSPEQFRGLELDGRSDIYSLGVVLYELAVGVPPFTGSTVAELAEQHLRAEPPPPRLARPQIPADLEAIILRCLAKEPAQRFADAGALADALREVGRRWPARSDDPLLSDLLAAAAPPAPPRNGGRIDVRLGQEQIELTPGQAASVPVRLINAGPATDEIVVSAEGVPAAWLQRQEPPVRLAPGAETLVALFVTVPRAPESLAGDYTVTVRARSATNPAHSGMAAMRWTVLPYEAASLTLAPNTAAGYTEAQYAVTLRNDGNATTSYLLHADDDEQALRYSFAQGQASLAPGEEATLALTVSASPRLLGSNLPRDFDVRAESYGGPTPPAGAQFVQRAFIPIWAPLALSLLLFFAVLFSRVLPSLRAADAPATVEPTALATEAPTPTAEPGAPIVALFAVEPELVAPGQAVTVAWDVQGAERVWIDQFGDVPPQGRREHRPEQTTDIRLVASGGGLEAVRIERVSVVAPTAAPTEAPTPTAAPGAPIVTLFAVEPELVAPGQAVTVAWDVQGAERVWIDQFGDVPPQGRREHRPEQTTDIRLVASGGGLEAVRIERVSVVAPTAIPTVVPTAAPTATPPLVDTPLPTAQPTAVPTLPPAAVNLLDQAPSARWGTDSASRLRFGRPASNAEQGGWADFANNITLEDGQQYAVALYTLPPLAPAQSGFLTPEGGPFIEGQFELGQIQAGQLFLADVGFAQEAFDPAVDVQISFSGEIIYEVRKQRDGQLLAISVDLSRFVGRAGRLDMRVSESSGAAIDGIYWLQPRIDLAGR